MTRRPLVAVIWMGLYTIATAHMIPVSVPISGPVSGGTIAFVTLPSICGPARCIMSSNFTSVESAILLNQSKAGNATWHCITPSAASLSLAARASGGALLATASLTGGAVHLAQLHDDSVRLTGNGRFNQIGTLTIPPPLLGGDDAAADIELAFELMVGRGTGGNGFSISFAVPNSRSAYYDEGGAPSGLAISFRTLPGIMLVQFRGEQLAERRLDGIHPMVCHNPCSNKMHRTCTRCTDNLPSYILLYHSMRLRQMCDVYNCEKCSESLCRQSGCQWVVMHGQCQQMPGSAYRHEFRTGTFVPVVVNLVGGKLTVWHNNYRYIDQLRVPGWDEMARTSAWRIIFGSSTGFQVDDHVVRGIHVTQGAYVGTGSSRLHVTGSTLNHTLCNKSSEFRYYALPNVLAMTPSLGPVTGGTTVTVRFTHWDTRVALQAACRFGENTVAAFIESSASISCITPFVRAPASLPVSVALNGQDFIDSGFNFSFTSPSLITIEPNVTFADHPVTTILTLSGSGLHGGDVYECRFVHGGNTIVHGAIFDDTLGQLICEAPNIHNISGTISVNVEVSLNGVDFTSSNMTLVYYPRPKLDRLWPTIGPSSGASRVLVYGKFAALAKKWVS